MLALPQKSQFSPREPELLAIFKALGESLRLEFVRQLAVVDLLPSSALEQTLPVAKSTISHHISTRYHAHLIYKYKDGRNSFYRLRRDVFETHLPGFLAQIEAAS